MPVWRNPAAWIGAIALAIPLAVHLLARVQAKTIAFPSLRFIQPSRLAALKRRRLTDVLLLTLRLLALALAVAAFANPLFLTSARHTAWSAQFSRAIVIDTSTSMSRDHASEDAQAAANRERSEPHTQRSTKIETAKLRAGVERAVAWLQTTPPSRREIVCISDFQVGTVDAALLRTVPPDIGLRFIRVGAVDVANERSAETRPVTTRASGRATQDDFAWRRARLRVTRDAVAVLDRSAASSPPIAITATTTATATEVAVAPFGVRVTAARADQAALLAAIRAVLAEGVPGDGGGAGQGAQAERARLVAVLFAGAGDPLPATSALMPLAAPWMADALDFIARDDALRRSIALASGRGDGSGGVSGAATQPAREPAAHQPSAAPASASALSSASASASLSTAAAASSTTSASAPWVAVLSDSRAAPVVLAAARVREGQGGGRELVLVARMSASAAATPLLLRAVLRAVAGPDLLPEAEVRTISDRALSLWTRPAAEPAAEAFRQVEDSDRRWLWAVVIAVLVIEMWARRERAKARRQTTGETEAHERAA